jgi:hypothetical protein
MPKYKVLCYILQQLLLLTGVYNPLPNLQAAEAHTVSLTTAQSIYLQLSAYVKDVQGSFTLTQLHFFIHLLKTKM